MQASNLLVLCVIVGQPDDDDHVTCANGGAPFVSTNSPDRLGDGDGTDGEAPIKSKEIHNDAHRVACTSGSEMHGIRAKLTITCQRLLKIVSIRRPTFQQCNSS
jgi:hypothetical protein